MNEITSMTIEKKVAQLEVEIKWLNAALDYVVKMLGDESPERKTKLAYLREGTTSPWGKGYAAGRASQQGELDYWREEAERLREKIALNKTIKISGSTHRERIRNSLVITLRTAMAPQMAERAVELIEELIETKETK